MTRIKIFQSLTAVLIVAIALLAPASFAAAQSAGTGQALEIGPPVISITGDPGQTLTTNISLRDVSASDLYVTNQLNDFQANGEDGTPKVILDNSVSPYSIKSWIRSISPLTLKSRQVKTIKVTIDIPAAAAPGGYYGIIRFTGVPPELKDSSGVSLNASLGSLIFIKVNGQAKEQLNIEEFSTNSGNGKATWLLQSKPITFVERVKNTGNTFEQPTGIVVVKDMFGKVVANLQVNADQRLILSNSTRRFEQKLDNSVIGNKILFGKYTADFTLTYGASSNEIKQSLTFWVIPYTLIALIIVGLIILFFILRYLIRRYNNMIVGKATGISRSRKPGLSIRRRK